MTQYVFSGEAVSSKQKLDDNFTELYNRTANQTSNGLLTGLGGTATQKLSVFGGNIGVDSSARKIGYLDGDATHQGYFAPYTGTGTTEVHNTFVNGRFSVFTGNADLERLVVDQNGVTRAGADNAYTLGSAPFRWSVVYAGTGSINTSDAREKTAVTALAAAELAAAKDLSREVGAFRFLAAVAEKGDQARLHIGLTVQRAIEVMAAHGLDATRYAFVCYDEWAEQVIQHPAVVQPSTTQFDEAGQPLDEVVHPAWVETIPAGSRYGFRPDELLLFLARGLEARLTALETA